MGRKLAIPMLMIAAGCLTVFVTVEPRHGQATLEQAQPKHNPQPAEAPGVPMGRLEGRDYGLRIEATAEGPRYTVVDEQGVIIAERLSRQALAARFPALAPGEFYVNEEQPSHGPLMLVPDNGRD